MNSWLGKWKPGLLTITLVALLVRAWTATWTGLTTDEANGVVIAVTGSWSDMILHLKEDGNPPLLSTLLRLYSGMLGHSDLTMKLFTIAIGTMQIPISYFILRRFVRREIALQVIALLALSPPLVRYSTLIRAYALISILSLVSTWACVEVLSGRKGKLWPTLYGGSTALLVYGHYWGGFVALGQAFLAAYGWWKGWFDWSAIKRWLFGVAVSILLFLPWTPILYYQLHHDMSPWDVAPMPSVLLTEMSAYILSGTYFSLNPFSQICLVFASTIFMIVLFSPRVMIDERFDGRFWKVVTIAGLAAGLSVCLFIPAMRDRYLTPFTPLFTIVYVTTFHLLFPRLPAVARAVLPVAIWLPMWIPQLVSLAAEPETGTPAIVAEIEHGVDRKKDLVLISWPIITPAINFYLPSDINVISFPDLTLTKINRWDGMVNRLRNQKNLDLLFRRLTETLDSGGRIWLIDRYHAVETKDYRDNSLLKGLSYMDSETCRMDQIRTWLSEHAQQVGTNKLAPGRDFSVFLSIYESLPKGSRPNVAPPKGSPPKGSPPKGSPPKGKPGSGEH